MARAEQCVKCWVLWGYGSQELQTSALLGLVVGNLVFFKAEERREPYMAAPHLALPNWKEILIADYVSHGQDA